jgi:hypothetical protein
MTGEVRVTEEQPARVLAAVGIATADVGQPAVNFHLATRMMAVGGDAVADVSLPTFVVADAPLISVY